MKFKSVSTKLNIAIFGVSVTSLIVAFFILFWYAKQIQLDVYTNTKQNLISNAQDRIASKNRVGITNAISIANDERIKTAFRTNQRQLAIDSLKDISQKMREYTEFKNIKVHLHTKENRSFLRNWKLDKYGDDLSSFRAAVVTVNKELKPIITFEPGRAGLLLRAITPIIDENGTHLGSLEFIQGINSVVKAFDRSHEGFLLLMDQNVNDTIKTGKNFSFNKSKKFQDYIISQKYMNQAFFKDAKSLDMEKLLHNGYTISKNYFYTYMKVKDFQNKELGIVLLAKPLSMVNTVIDRSQKLVYISLIGILAMMIIIILVIITAIKKLVLSPLKIFETGLSDFFLFLQGKKDYTENIHINTDDEFGEMAKSLKENIAVSAKLHEEIGELNTNLEAKVEEKTKKITTLLDNAGQGFLSFGRNFLIDDEYSIECIKFLGNHITGKDIGELLFKDEAKKAFFKKTVLDTHELHDSIVKRSMLSLLPNEIILNQRALKLEYKIIDADKMMLILTNISAQKKLEKKIKREQQVLKMIVEIVSESDSFYDTKKDYEEFIASYEKYVDMSKSSLHNISEIYRMIHTFKGTFSQLYMSRVVEFLHSLESDISSMIKENQHTNETLLELLNSCDFTSSLEEEYEVIREILGDDFLNSQNFVKVPFSEVKALQNKICTMFATEHIETKQAQDIIEHVRSLSHLKLLNLLKPYPHVVQQLAQRLEKEVYDFEIIGSEDLFVADEYRQFVKSLIHVFRNCVDHGIETPEERLENGKEEIGTISCSFEQEGDNIIIIISDDGAGIDKQKLLSKALYQNLITPEKAEEMSDDEVYALIFHEQFSTKDEISDISGRGVGMDAIKSELDKINGNVKITTLKNSGTTFIFTLPQQEGEL